MKMLSPDSDNSPFLSKDSASRVFGKYGNWKQAGSAVMFDNAVQSSDLDRQNKNLTNQMVQANMIQVNLSSDAQKIINKYLDQQESVREIPNCCMDIVRSLPSAPAVSIDLSSRVITGITCW